MVDKADQVLSKKELGKTQARAKRNYEKRIVRAITITICQFTCLG